MSAPEDPSSAERRNEAMRWLVIAEDDVDVALAAIDLPRPRAGVAPSCLRRYPIVSENLADGLFSIAVSNFGYAANDAYPMIPPVSLPPSAPRPPAGTAARTSASVTRSTRADFDRIAEKAADMDTAQNASRAGEGAGVRRLKNSDVTQWSEL